MNMADISEISLVAGATGLVGRHVVSHLGAMGKPAIALARREMDDLPESISQHIVDYEDVVNGAPLPEAGRAFICLGSTIKKAGTWDAFSRVDHDYVIAAAQAAWEAGARRLAVVSSINATASSGNRYIKLKGEVEEALEQFPFKHLSIMQPGLILGDRINDWRLGEQIAVFLTPVFNPLLRGSSMKYRSIHASNIASAMIAQVEQGAPGTHRLTYEQMMALAG
jgi:uncharacterized protein YbjT (DUF2867 family)